MKKRWAILYALFMSLAHAAPLATLHDIHTLSNDQAAHAPAVAFEATVTYYRNDDRNLFVQEGDEGIFVWPSTDIKVAPGDRVLIRGAAHSSFRPMVVATSITVTGHGPQPKPVAATFRGLIQAQFDCDSVKVRGMVRSVNSRQSSGFRESQIMLLMDGGYVSVNIDGDDPARLQEMLDAEVEVTAVAGSLFDGKMQMTGVLLHSNSLDNIRILRRAKANPWSLPVTPMDRVLSTLSYQERTRRVLVEGILTYFRPGALAVLQDGSRSIRVLTPRIDPLRLGLRVQAIGIPGVEDGFLTLRLGELREAGEAASLVPMPVQWSDLASGNHAFDLVSVEGQVVTQVREAGQDVYIVSAQGHLFSAVLVHPRSFDPRRTIQPPPLRVIPAGARVRVSGVVNHDSADRYSGPMAFGILLRDQNDVAIVANPPWVSVRNLILVVCLLGLVVIAIGAWNWILKRKVATQAVALAVRMGVEAEAALERQRSRILEDITHGRPLDGILDKIVELLSSNLGHAPCWCKIDGREQIGRQPQEGTPGQTVCEEIPARNGPAYGRLCVTVDPQEPHAANAAVTLSIGAGLAALAIETQRLYSDLRYRSEFDLLTETCNRFSFESRLDKVLEAARTDNRVLGLVYVDLNDFKKVNDMYGHPIGDQYLREAAARMQHQLRAGDVLARMGGDEFAAIVVSARCRVEVEEIAQRLERCFDEPFLLQGCTFPGSCSAGVAIFPEDGETKEDLLRRADAVMYAAKHQRKGIRRSVRISTNVQL